MAKFLVTGSAGFIGSNLVDYLLTQGHEVVAVDNMSTGLEENNVFLSSSSYSKNFLFIKSDIRDLDSCIASCKGVDYVLHQAALGSVPRSLKEPELYNDNNITGTYNMMKAAAENNVKRFVYASSSSVYGDTQTLPKVETMTPRPKSPYAISKITNEYYGKIFWECFDLPTIGLRYFNVFGPRQNPNSEYAAVVPSFITSYLNNKAPVIYGDGEQTRDFTYIQNVIDANLNACDSGEGAFGKSFNIGCGQRISVNDLVFEIKKAIASDLDPIYESSRIGDVRDSLASIDFAKKHLKLNQKVFLEEGLLKTIEWYQRNNKI